MTLSELFGAQHDLSTGQELARAVIDAAPPSFVTA
jgi:hypothetical protein